MPLSHSYLSVSRNGNVICHFIVARLPISRRALIGMPPSKPANQEAHHRWHEAQDYCHNPKAPASNKPGITAQWAPNNHRNERGNPSYSHPAVRLRVKTVNSAKDESCAHKHAGHTAESNGKPAKNIRCQLSILGSSEHSVKVPANDQPAAGGALARPVFGALSCWATRLRLFTIIVQVPRIAVATRIIGSIPNKKP